ncbi:MAG: hypothetical protein WCJ19_03575 [bacterium]
MSPTTNSQSNVGTVTSTPAITTIAVTSTVPVTSTVKITSTSVPSYTATSTPVPSGDGGSPVFVIVAVVIVGAAGVGGLIMFLLGRGKA